MQLTERLEAEGHSLVLIDLLVFEALSVICRRAAQRKTAAGGIARGGVGAVPGKRRHSNVYCTRLGWRLHAKQKVTAIHCRLGGGVREP